MEMERREEKDGYRAIESLVQQALRRRCSSDEGLTTCEVDEPKGRQKRLVVAAVHAKIAAVVAAFASAFASCGWSADAVDVVSGLER